MVFPSDPPGSGASASGKKNLSLEAGLADLKQGNYESAIAQLESVVALEQSQKAISRAKMGLVVAYERIGEVQKAIVLAEQLTNNSNSQVKEWGDRTLTRLNKSYPQENRKADQQKDSSPSIPESKETGFIPLENINQNSSRPKVVITPNVGEQGSRGAGEQGSRGAGEQGSKGAGEQGSKGAGEQGEQGEQGRKKDSLLSNPEVLSNPKALPIPKQESSDQPQWKQAPRRTRGERLPVKVGFRFDKSQLWGVQIITAIALLIPVHWVITGILRFGISKVNDLLIRLRIYYPNEYSYTDPASFAGIWAVILGIAMICSLPWLIDGLLRFYYGGIKPLSLETLTSKSPEATKLLQRFTREKRLSSFTLFVLPNSVPIAFSYGNLPRTARIVVSEGLLNRLADDEIAAIFAANLAHIVNWDFFLMSLGVLVTQIPYIFYQRISELGEASSNGILRLIAGAIAALFYGIYWLFRWPILWLSRARIYYSDRMSCEITGNPNGLTRALLKIAIRIAENIQQQGQTSYLLESFELLSPLGYRQAITLGSLYPYTPLEPILAWDYLNPYHRWLAINNSHPPIGERLEILSRYAKHWKLETELNLQTQTTSKSQKGQFFRQGAPYFGILLGLGLGGTLWIIGWISKFLKIRQFLLDWMWGDRSLLYGCLLIGISIGILWRINAFFPDIKPSNQKNEADLPDLLANPATLPVNSQPMRLQGKLLGRTGISNWLCQDLILQTANGLVKLHYFSGLGPIGNIFLKSPRPSEFVKREVTVTGWFRRGATPWIDVDTLRIPHKILQSGHPWWSTILALLTAVVGVYIIYRGNI